MEERRCAEIDSLASQQFNTTELLLHSSPYEMRSLSLSGSTVVTCCVFVYVCMYMCVSACVYQYMCDPLMSRSIIYNLVLKVHLSVSLFYVSLFLFYSLIFPIFCVCKMNFKLFIKVRKV